MIARRNKNPPISRTGTSPDPFATGAEPAGGFGRGLPQLLQNWLFSGLSEPHTEHLTGKHLEVKLFSGVMSMPKQV
jgi:hypothetical protein